MKPTIIALSTAALLGLTVPTAAGAKQITFSSGDFTSGSFGDSNIPKGNFSDYLNFSVSDPGQFGSSITSVALKLKSAGDVNFTSIFLTGPDGTYNFDITQDSKTTTSTGGVIYTDSADLSQYLAVGDYTLTINGYSYGKGQYGGNSTFIAAVPEMQTWAMLILGMGAIGGTLRVRRRQSTRVSFA